MWWVFLLIVIVGFGILALNGIFEVVAVLVGGDKWERIFFAVMVLLFVLFIWFIRS